MPKIYWMNPFLSFCFIIALSFTTNTFSQALIKGQILDQDGRVLPGASIELLNYSIGAISDMEGKYELANVPEGTQTIKISFLGYATKLEDLEVINTTTLDVQLQEEALELSEVVVSATKRQEEVQDIPIAISSIGAQRVEALQINNINEIGRIAPNFSANDDGGGSFPLMASRGVFTIDESPVVGVYVDDVPLFFTYSFPSVLEDIERIEILRGPQGTLYGRNTLAGAINIITKKPSNQFKGFIEAGYGNLNQYQVEAGVSGPLVQDKLFYRLSGGYNSRDGYINNLALQSDDLLSRQASFGNLRLAYVPSNKFSITLNSSFENRDAVAYALVGGFGVDGATIDSLRENAPYQVSIDGQGDYETLSLNNALKLDYTTDKISFKSITSIQYNNLNRSGEDFDFTPFDLSLIGNQERTDLTIAEELRVNSVGNRKLNWLGGLFLYSVSTDNFTPIISGADNALFATNPEDAAIYPFTTVDEADQDQIGIAVFANIDYALTDKLKIIAGLRYEREEFDTDLRRFYIREGDEGFSYPNLGLIPDEFTAEATFEAVSPKFGLSYNLSDDILLWGNIARGYRPGGINPYTTNREQAVFDPESSWNYELGVKSNLFDNRIKLNLTGFYLNYDDQQLFTVVDITTFNFGRANLGRSESYGLELETEWIVSKGLRFIGNLAYLETEIVDFEIIGFSGEVDNRGNRQGFSPRWSGNAGLSYQDEFGPFKFNATVDYQYQTDVFFDPENALRQPAYGLLSARVSLGYQNYELSLWGDNITDEVYFSYGYGVGAAALFGSYGLPRTYGSNFTIRF